MDGIKSNRSKVSGEVDRPTSSRGHILIVLPSRLELFGVERHA